MPSSLTATHRERIGESVRSTIESKRQQGLPVNAQAAKTKCPAGHEYTDDNTVFSNGGTVRHCRTCRNKNSREYRARERGRSDGR